MASDKVVKMIEEVKALTVLELSELVKALETEFGVSAAAPAAAAPAAAGAPAVAAEEQTEFTVILKDVGADKIKVIKVVREVTGLGLKEAKDVVDGAPKTVKENVTKDEAAAIEAKFKEVGAGVEIK
jgi:large subunit ribosomal protein L7/L12